MTFPNLSQLFCCDFEILLGSEILCENVLEPHCKTRYEQLTADKYLMGHKYTVATVQLPLVTGYRALFGNAK